MKPADMACFWYAVGAYKKLRLLPENQVKEIADFCSELSQRQPLWDYHKPEFALPHIGNGLTGLNVIACFAVSVDILSGGQITERRMSFEWLNSAKKTVQMFERKEVKP